MLINFFKVAYRSLVKNKIFTLLNILGLAIGMAACFFIFQYVHFERCYESYNPNANNIYRVPLEYQESSGSDFIQATNYPPVGPALKANFPDVVSVARLIPDKIMSGTTTMSRIEGGVTKFSSNETRVFLADAPILRMFSVHMIYGNDTTALTQIRSVVISESEAKKYFGTENPMGKTLYMNVSWPVTVTGVFKDIPENSHLKFDVLISFPDEKFQADNWSWPEFYTYVKLAPGADPKTLEDQFPAFIKRYLGSVNAAGHFKNRIFLQPIKDIHLKSHYRKELEANGSERDIWFLSILSFFVLLIACINYINLSTAKVMERAGEVGLRKVIGASKSQLVGQFLTESVVVNFLAVILAALIVVSLAPFYQNLIGKSVTGWFWKSGLLSESVFWIVLLLIIIGGSFLIGVYPALLMSRYNPVHVLKGKFYSSRNGIFVRKILVAFQFILAIILIAGSVTVFNQLNYMRSQSLGYDGDQVLVVKTPGIYGLNEYPKIYTLERELLNKSFINGVGLSTEIPGESIDRKSGARMFGESRTRNTDVSITQIDDHFLNAYHIKLIAGRSFKQEDRVDVFPIDRVTFPDKISVIANESFVKNLGFKTNEDALNKLITFGLDGHDLKGEIMGVIKDYHQTSLKDPYQPTMYLFPLRTEWRYFSINLNSKNLQRNISSIQKSYENLFPDNPFSFFFQDNYFDAQYKSDQQFGKIFNAFTALSIFVSFLGLLGLLSFMTRIRSKEIGIRRVLGASVYSILGLFYRDFFKLILLATIIALPIIYFGGNKWLDNFAFREPLNISVFILPTLILVVVTFIAVIAQSLKAALTNPVTSLRDE